MSYNIDTLLGVMVEADASDLYVSLGAYPMLSIKGKAVPLEREVITPEMIAELREQMLTERHKKIFAENNELDFIYSLAGLGRFRINFFKQRGSDAFVARRIVSEIKTLEELNLPPILADLSEKERGIILLIGSTGSGKSTTLAAMVDHRNSQKAGHILTIEDPIEFLHRHKKSIVNQREIGSDTWTYSNALKSALREAPDMLLLGEIRDQEAMEAALNFSETGHLVLSTLHATNASQTLQRIMSMFPPSQHEMIRMQLSQNLQGIIGQRLIPTIKGARVAALEIMLSTARIRDLLLKGDMDMLRHTMEAGLSEGMITFDIALERLFRDGQISMDQALKFADRPTDIRVRLHAEDEELVTEFIELEKIEDDNENRN